MTKKTIRKSKFKALVTWSSCVMSISTVVVDSSKKKKRGVVNGHGYIYSFDYAEFVRKGYAKIYSKLSDGSRIFVVKVTDNMFESLKRAFGEDDAIKIMASIFRYVEWEEAFTYPNKSLNDDLKTWVNLIVQNTAADLDKKKHPHQSILTNRSTFIMGLP